MDLAAWCLWFKRRGAGRLRRVLMHDWDPIGVQGEPAARDEYDSYLGRVADRLRTNASADQVAGLLAGIRTREMGLWSDKGADMTAARTLIAWYATEMARLEKPAPARKVQ